MAKLFSEDWGSDDIAYELANVTQEDIQKSISVSLGNPFGLNEFQIRASIALARKVDRDMREAVFGEATT